VFRGNINNNAVRGMLRLNKLTDHFVLLLETVVSWLMLDHVTSRFISFETHYPCDLVYFVVAVKCLITTCSERQKHGGGGGRHLLRYFCSNV
jgi:hypothetical protein